MHGCGRGWPHAWKGAGIRTVQLQGLLGGGELASQYYQLAGKWDKEQLLLLRLCSKVWGKGCGLGCTSTLELIPV
jgi:hypothetical protein